MAGFVVINRKVFNFSSKANSKANGRHYRKENKLKVFFSRSLFSQKYFAENFSRGQSFHSASFLIDFLSKKASFFRSIFSISSHRKRAASVSLLCTKLWYIKSEKLIQFKLLFFWILTWRETTESFRNPKCNDNELVQNNSLSQFFPCLNLRQFQNIGVNYTCREKFYH